MLYVRVDIPIVGCKFFNLKDGGVIPIMDLLMLHQWVENGQRLWLHPRFFVNSIEKLSETLSWYSPDYLFIATV